MITIITGDPGVGKTSMAVLMMMTEFVKRPVFCAGVKDLKLPHEKLPPIPEWTEFYKDDSYVGGVKLGFTFPERAVIFLDEAQQVYRPRAGATKVPDHVAAFETHRHEAIDFVLMTQDISFLDANIRKLCQRHIHIRDTLIGRYLYEWREAGDPDNKSSRDNAARRRYRPPSKVFGLYKSARSHTRVAPRRIPTLVLVLGVCVLGLGYLVQSMYKSWKPRIESAGVAPKGDLLPASMSAKGSSAVARVKKPGDDLADYLAAHGPRLSGLAYTAPVYDAVTAVKEAPFPSACVANEKRCQCYTDQVTTLSVPDELCRQIVSRGLFRPFADNKAPSGGEAAKRSSSAGPVVAERIVTPEGPSPNLPDREPLKLSPGFHSGDVGRLPPDLGPARQKYPPSGGSPSSQASSSSTGK